MTLKSWVLEYLQTYKCVNLKQSTLKSYLYAAQHIPDDLQIDQLTCKSIQGIINNMVFSGLSWSTVSHTYTLISQALSQAQNYGFPDKSHLLKGIMLPKKQKKRVRAFSPEQLQLFRAHNHGFHADHFSFLLLTGLRIGELIGLQQQDLDIRRRCIQIQRNYYRGSFQTPKTDESQREIPLSAEAWRIVQKRIVLGRPAAPLFTGQTGRILDYRSMLSAFTNLLQTAGLPHSGIHVLRHTFATELLRRGVNLKIISDLLGHSTIKTTCDIYSDVSLEMKFDAVSRFDLPEIANK